MALTAEGRALTEAHRRQQLAIASRADVSGRALWSRLDVADLDRSTPAWLAANVGVAQQYFTQSANLATAYVSEYRRAELGAAVGPVVSPRFNTPVMTSALLLAGPVRVKMLVGRGMSGDMAHGAALAKFSGIMRRQVLSGGRMMIHETTSADRRAVGWRRVTDGDPCTFCAMLASRGPVYARDTAQVTSSGLRYHGHCGCTAEIVYGEWVPTDLEQQFIESYEKAAEEATEVSGKRVAPKPGNDEDTILWRMRRDGIFRDSPLARNK